MGDLENEIFLLRDEHYTLTSFKLQVLLFYL